MRSASEAQTGNDSDGVFCSIADQAPAQICAIGKPARPGNESGRVAGGTNGRPRCFVVNSPSMRAVRAVAEAAATRSCTVLIQGESGVGKEMIARHIHTSSARAAGPLVFVNCANLCESLLESQLFGHVKGAFTGAEQKALGFFRAAEGGTLVLDEIGELARPLQAKLLRCLEDRAVVPLGGVAPVPIDTRIIAITHRDLREMAGRGAFREDLLYRLAVVCIRVPPLRERADEIMALADHFLAALADFYGDRPKALSAAAGRFLQTYPWPGNVRELANVMEQMCISVKGDCIGVSDLPPFLSEPFAGAHPRPHCTLAEAERDCILAALQRASFVRSRAATLLAIEPRRLNRLISRLGIPVRAGQAVQSCDP